MKICTACSATYSDDTLNFCLVDGTTLTPEKQISYEQVPFSYEPGSWSDAEVPPPASENLQYSSNFEPPPRAANSFSPPPTPAPQNISTTAPRNNSNRNLLFPAVAVGAVLLAAVVGLLMVTSSGNSGGSSYPVAVRANSNVGAVRAANTAVVVNSEPASTKSAPANISNLSNTGKPIPRKTDFTGIWKGKFNEVPATLSITTQKGDTFSGTLSKNGYVIELTGKINFEKGTVAITETEVLQTPANSKWNLGTNDGTISEDGKSMGGTGKDKNGSYPWSFTKD